MCNIEYILYISGNFWINISEVNLYIINYQINLLVFSNYFRISSRSCSQIISPYKNTKSGCHLKQPDLN